MKRGFTLVEVAVALLLVGVVAYMILALSRTLEAGAATGLEEEVLHAAETVLETGLDAPPCGSSPPLVLTLAGKSYRICQQTAGLSITPPANTSVYAYTYTFEEVSSNPSRTFSLTQVTWEGSPPPPPPSPNFTATCQKASSNQLQMTVTNAGASVTTRTLALSWNGEGKKRIVAVSSGGTTLWSNNKGVKKGTPISLSQNLTFGSQTLTFTFNANFKAGNYTFTLFLYVGQGNNQVTYTASCSLRW